MLRVKRSGCIFLMYRKLYFVTRIITYILDWFVRAVRLTTVPFPTLVMALRDTLYSEYDSKKSMKYFRTNKGISLECGLLGDLKPNVIAEGFNLRVCSRLYLNYLIL